MLHSEGAVYSNQEQGGNYNERAEGDKGKDGEGRNTACGKRGRSDVRKRGHPIILLYRRGRP